MPVNYDFYENPKLPGSTKRTRYHARVISKGTISSEQLAEEIHERCSLSTADVAAALLALSQITAEKLKDGYNVHIEGIGHLKDGYNVHIEGIGHLQLTLQCPPIQSPKEIRAESIYFKSIAFRPSASLKRKLQATRFVRQEEKSHSKLRAEEEIDQRVADYFQKHETLTRAQFQSLCGLTYTTAVRHLKRLREAGKIINIASPRHPLYRRGDDSQESAG